jgi:hypothetical protein
MHGKEIRCLRRKKEKYENCHAQKGSKKNEKLNKKRHDMH